MRNRYDEKASKMFFGTNLNKKNIINKEGIDPDKHLMSQQ